MSGEDEDRYVTDDVVWAPWLDPPAEVGEPVLHLVVAFFLGEPDRVGHAARIDREGFVGRSHGGPVDEAPIAFVEQRPGESMATSDFMTKSISRRQLRITPQGGERALVENVGKRAMYVNGEPVRECTVRAGDTLMLENVAVLLVEPRPAVLQPSAYYRAAAFPFGGADAHGMVGESRAAWDLRDQLAGAAATDSHVLLVGETGVGKEVAAGVLHGLSGRAHGPLVARNAATMPDTLLDAELFGSARNYPNTGAPEREGLIGAAHGGHLMLDEIGELPEGHQAHLLRVLDSSGQYHRLGETRARVSDFRLVAATNRSPSSLKHDFLARFGQRVRVPGLNQRLSDIPFLLRELLSRMLSQTPDLVERFLEDGDVRKARLEPRLVDALLRHEYREHTRELHRLLQVAITTSRGQYLSLTPELGEELAANGASSEARASEIPPASGEGPSVGESEIRRILEAVGGNVTQAANQLGLSRYALHRLLKAHGIVKRFDLE